MFSTVKSRQRGPVDSYLPFFQFLLARTYLFLLCVCVCMCATDKHFITHLYLSHHPDASFQNTPGWDFFSLLKESLRFKNWELSLQKCRLLPV